VRKNYCDRCPKKEKCRRTCPIVTAELAGKKKNRIRLVSESELTGADAAAWANNVYGVQINKDEAM
jgi:hypothetical protein